MTVVQIVELLEREPFQPFRISLPHLAAQIFIERPSQVRLTQMRFMTVMNRNGVESIIDLNLVVIIDVMPAPAIVADEAGGD